MRSLSSLLVWVVLLGAGAALAGYTYVYHLYLPQLVATEVALSATTDFRISPGEGVGSVAARLAEEGVVTHDWAFVEYLKREDLDGTLQAGFFQFAAGSHSMASVAQQLQRGGAEQISFTVLEGWTSIEIDDALAAKGLISSGDFATFVREGGALRQAQDDSTSHWAADRPVVSLEGYLFPATYFVDPNRFSVEELVNRMLEEMNRQLQLAGYTPATSDRTLHQVLTMASMVEREERTVPNKPLVADILWRRLDDGWQLGVDATLLYTLGHKEFLTVDDLAMDNPYNTRNRRGLPPTPIAAPSAAALAATLSPEANGYWYYLHDPTGQIHFAVDLAGHNANKQRYLR